MTLSRLKLAVQAALAATILFSGAVHAQAYPSRTVTIIVPFSAGTGPDVLAREIATFLQKKLSGTVVVDNKPGAGTMIASKFVADATPDGYTLFMNGSSSMLAPELNPVTRGKNYMRDVTFVSPVAMFPNSIQVSGELAVRTLPEFIAYAKANPGKVSYATPGIGSGPHIQTEWFKLLTGTEMTHVPYKSYDVLYADLISGRVHMTIATYDSAKPFLEGNKVRILALTTAARVPGLDYPTAIEAGVPGLAVVPWVGISAPKGTPANIVAVLDKHIQEAIADPAFVAKSKARGMEPMPGNSRQFKEFAEKDLDRYVKVIKDAGIKID